MPKLKRNINNESEIKKFTLLEKDLLIIEKPIEKNCLIKIPNVQSCICLIMWHKDLCAVIHANGKGNEVAAYNYMVDQFKNKGIKNSEVDIYMIGGFYNKKSSFCSDLIFWALGADSTFIMKPMLKILKQNQFQIESKKQIIHKSAFSGNFCIHFRANSISSLEIDESDDERAYIMGIKNELERRNISPKMARTRAEGPNSTYQVFNISREEGGLRIKQVDETHHNNWSDTFSTFPL